MTPFAWGRCGLVLPRYPGTRVALLHRAGRPRTRSTSARCGSRARAADAKPGDWWLILPAGSAAAGRAALAPDSSPEHAGAATNDLIDADGNRVIEVGELTVRVGREQLRPGDAPGTRGRRGLGHDRARQQGSKIVMRADGTIVIDGQGQPRR